MSDAPPRTKLFAVAGNPNSGKSTLFNMLTGSAQTVGNYPGVTVDRVEGTIEQGDHVFTLVDLPGTYSLTAYSQDEIVARDFIIDEKPSAVINVVDASNLERNLYLTTQLCEMGVPVIVCLNMSDIARQRGIVIDTEALSGLLGVPVVATVGHKEEGRAELLEVLRKTVENTILFKPQPVAYQPVLERAVSTLSKRIEADKTLSATVSPRWFALKLLEQDEEAIDVVMKTSVAETKLLDLAEKQRSAVEDHEGEDCAMLITEQRYGFAAGVVRQAVEYRDHGKTMTDSIDTIVCNRWFGFGFVALMMFVTFKLTFLLADGIAFIPWKSDAGWAMPFTEGALTPVGVFGWIFESFLPQLTVDMAEGPLKSLINDGAIAGVGGVMGFVPLIFFMFLLLALIEDSGYIARIAFVLDRVLRTFGLQGKSILAMIVSGGIAGGCAVPGVMATRTLREEKDRLTTMLVAPLMNCGAKLPVFAMLIAAFFADRKGEMLWILAMLSWCFALTAAWLLRKFVVKGEQTPFVMELPPYHLPIFRHVLRSALGRSWTYMKKAGTIILGLNVILWALMYFPRADVSVFEQNEAAAMEAFESILPADVKAAAEEHATANATEPAAAYGEVIENPELLAEWDMTSEVVAIYRAEASQEQLTNSIAGRAGRLLEPVSKAAGFDWRDNIALIGGFAAKEVIVSTLSIAYSMGEAEGSEDVSESSELPIVRALQSNPNWNPLRAAAFLLFVMIYAPCMVTIAAIWRETRSFKWAIFSTVYSTTAAFIVATVVYRVGLALGFGG